MVLKIIFALAILSSSFALASGGGSVAGNGGDALVCKNGEVLFFDIFEAQEARGLHLDLGSPSLDPVSKVHYVLDRIPKGLYDWKRVLEAHLELFIKRTSYGDFDLVDIPDTNNIVIKPDCELKQAVIQRAPIVPYDSIFYVSKALWSRMDNDSRAALILHEIIYYEGIYNGHKDSQYTRAINSYLMAEKLEPSPLCALTRILQSSKQSKLMQSLFVGSLLIDGERSIVGQGCVIVGGRVKQGTLNVNGLNISPVLAKSTLFPNEWGVDQLPLSGFDLPRILHFEKEYNLVINGLQVALAKVRTRDWEKTEFWHVYRPEPFTAEIRPGFMSFFREKIVDAASVENLEWSIFGQVLKVRGEVHFGSNANKIKNIYFVPHGTLRIFGADVVIDKIMLESKKGIESYVLYPVPDSVQKIKDHKGVDHVLTGKTRIRMSPEGAVISISL